MNLRLEHGVYNLARVRDAATSRYARFQIPWEWMKQDAGIVSQVTKLPIPSPIYSPWGILARSRHCSTAQSALERELLRFQEDKTSSYYAAENPFSFGMPSAHVCRGVTTYARK